MIIKASGRSALILATGLFVCFAGPSQAEPGDDTAIATSKSEKAAGAPIALNKYTKPRHSKKHAQRKSSKAALKSSAARKATDEPDDTDVADVSGNPSTTIPPSVANANAHLAPEVPADSARAMSAKANTMLQTAADKPADSQPAAEAEVVAPDQLNELDRALQEAKSEARLETGPTAPTVALASAEAPAAPAAPVMAASKEDSAWEQTSLIGKIFIAFGALLTMASAARMFMA
ncbi:MAG: hypothetical protein ABIL01_05645 [Pseudomonadota bacterium]